MTDAITRRLHAEALRNADEVADEIEGSRLRLPTGEVWVYTLQQVRQWLRDLADEVERTGWGWDEEPDLRPEFLSVAETAEALCISRQAVQQRINSGSLPAVRIGKIYAVPGSAIKSQASWLAPGTTTVYNRSSNNE